MANRTNADTFAAIIAGIQDATSWSHCEIGRRARVSHVTVSRFAMGEARAPTYETVSHFEKLAASVVRK